MLAVLVCVVALVELVWMFSDRHRAVHPDDATLPDLLDQPLQQRLS
jgi:hypothetical protein